MEINDARTLARTLMDQHGLHQWTLRFGPAKRSFGSCRPRRQEITLSAPLVRLNPYEQVRDTILHEIAHALVWPDERGHGAAWRAQALALGCAPRRCAPASVRQPPARFVGTCPRCRLTIRGHRRRRVSCGRCDTRFNPAYLLVWTKDPINGPLA